MKPCQTSRYFSRIVISCLLLWAAILYADPWPVADPESVGFQKDKLEKVAEYAKENTGTTGLVVVVNGKIIYTYGDIKQVSYTASCRKSILSMLYGKYVVDGTIKLDETIGQLGIDDVQGLLPQEKEATVYDLITARSGVYHPASNPGGIPEGKKYERGVTPHGTRFVYNNWDFNVAGTVFTLKTGLDIYDALERNLAIPLGMEDFDRARHKLSGNAEMSKHLAYYMHFSTRDMARLGQLMLQKGRWNGEQLIPEEWVTRSTSVVTPLNREFHCGYGILWWLLADKQYPEQFKGAFSAQGMYGQFITVFPAMNMVVAHKSAGNSKKSTKESQYRHILRLIVEASLPREKPAEPKAKDPAEQKAEEK
jgi:CubicO group peptidase (beta-lactamase class C family)